MMKLISKGKRSAYRKPVKVSRFIKPRRFIRSNKFKISRTMNPFPTNYMCQLRYSQVLPIAFSAGGWGYQRFRLNSLYDPDYSGVGHQPRGFDQLTPIYNKYLVLSAKYKIKFWQTSGVDAYVGFTVRKDASAPTVFEDWTEGQYGSSVVLKSDDNRVHYKKRAISMKKFFGKRMRLTDDDACVDYTSNPTDICNLVIGANDVSLSSAGSITCEVEIVYTAVFTKYKSLPSS